MLKAITNLFTAILNKFPVKVSTEDKKLGKLFFKEFPSNGKSCYFLKNHDLHNPFCYIQLEELDNFLDNWDNAEYVFLNKRFEKIRKKLFQTIEKFSFLLSLSVRVHEKNVNILTTRLLISESQISQEIKVKEELNIKKLNKMATDIYNLHQKLTLKIKKLLNN